MRRAERVLEGELLAPETDEQRAVRERLKFLAWLLDSSIAIPGTPYSVGLDAIVGLFPFIGDLIGVLVRSEEHTSELQSQSNLVCRLLLEKKKRQPSGTRHTIAAASS